LAAHLTARWCDGVVPVIGVVAHGGDVIAVQMDFGAVQICEDNGGAKVETLLLRSSSRFLLP